MQYYEFNGLPVVVLDNFFNEAALKEMWLELDYFIGNKMFQPPEFTGSAKTFDGNLLKRNQALQLDNYYQQNRNNSAILKRTQKLFNPDFMDEVLDTHIFWRYLKHSNSDGTLVSYYENSDYYKPHFDYATITALVWLFKEPKHFEGGDLILESTQKIEVKSNRVILFPSILSHEVTPISMPEEKTNSNLGRFTISKFISIGAV